MKKMIVMVVCAITLFAFAAPTVAQAFWWCAGCDRGMMNIGGHYETRTYKVYVSVASAWLWGFDGQDENGFYNWETEEVWVGDVGSPTDPLN